MSRLPWALMRHLDRASRWAHRHHRFAHHPLCAAYGDERLRIGRHHVCRGCTAAAAGLVAGAIGGALTPMVSVPTLTALTVAGGSIGLLALARRLPAGGKVVSRALPSCAAGFVAVAGALRADAIGAAFTCATLAAMFIGIALYKRRGPWRSACVTCPERLHAPCSGYRFAWRRERAFQRLAHRWIRNARTAATSPVP